MYRLVSLSFAALAVVGSTAAADTIIAGGNVINQTWTAANSPYIVQGDVTVPAGAFLTIEAGVEVRATANSDGQAAGDNTTRVELRIDGTLTVNGTRQNPVTLRSTTTTSGSWYGVIAGAAANVSLHHTSVQHPIHGLDVRTTGTFTTDHVTVQSASARGLWLRAGTHTLDTVAVTSAGSYGVYVDGTASPTLTSCVIRNSGSYGVYVAHDTAGRTVALTSCTLNANGIGVYSNAGTGNQAAITITSSILTNASYGVYRSDAATFAVSYSNVWNNTSGNFVNVTTGAGMLSANPLYVSSTDLRLTSNSPSRFGASTGGDQGALPYDVVPTPGLHGVLWSNTTLTAAASPYTAAGDLTVAPGVTLTIEPGAQVRFTANADLMQAGESSSRGELVVRGTLVADGTPAAPIVLTSTTTTSGSWYGVALAATATNTLLDHVTIQRPTHGLVYASTAAGNALSNVTTEAASARGFWLRAGSPTLVAPSAIGSGSYGVYVDGTASPTLTSCVIRNSGSYGVYVAHDTAGRTVTLTRCTLNANGIGVYSNAGTGNQAAITITDSILTNASYGVYRSDAATFAVSYSNVWNHTSGNFVNVTTGAGMLSANPLYVSSTDLRLTSNSPSRFGASAGGDQGALPYDVVPTPGLHGVLWSNTTLTAAASPYTAAGDLTVAPGVTLTIEPGATVRFTANGDLMQAGESTTRGELTVRGTLVADGTPAAPIVLTSTTTTSGSWYGVALAATATNTLLDHVTIQRPTHGLVYASTAAGNALSNVTTEAASARGFWLRAGSPTLVAPSAISSGSYGVYVDGTASPTLTSCVIRNSGSYGVYVAHDTAGRTVTLASCTLNANGIGVYSNAGTGNQAAITITNSILTNASYGVYRSDAATFAVSYSNVWNNTSGNFVNVTTGAGMLSANPLYVSSTDLHLQGSSVAIDAGTTGPARDADGISRPLDGNGIGGAQWDMGAYEYVLMAQCGNGAIEPGEACDSGANNGTYGHCNATCSAMGPACGDGVKNGPEQCDDGNTSNGDACLATCVTATCGDGFVRVGTEACDDGNPSNTDACLATCVVAACGDAYVQAGVEACDDGNAANTDACLTTCEAAGCGDGFVYAGTEDCDDGNTTNTDACLNTCEAAACGDGVVRTGVEACDDGNLIATDACTATCTVATCGDGVVHAGVEACDDANTSTTDACASCVAATCGDGHVQAGVEGCDDGNTASGDGCSTTCVSETCGDGTVQAGVEECDDGNQVETDGCRNTCTDAACGDGVVRDGVEECDDGNVAPGDGCSPGCRVEGTPPDAGPGPDGGMPDEPAGGGCCQTSGGGATGSLLLTALVLIGLRRRRR